MAKLTASIKYDRRSFYYVRLLIVKAFVAKDSIMRNPYKFKKWYTKFLFKITVV